MIKVGKKPENMTEQEFSREAVKEIQKQLKQQGAKLKFDVDEREKKLKAGD